MPLKNGIFEDEAVYGCEKLTTINIIGSIHKTINYLSLESWRNEIHDEIDRVNRVLPDADQKEKTHIIQQWMKSVIGVVEYCKNEHHNLIHEAMIQLDLALWKVNLDEMNGCSLGEVGTTTTNTVLSARTRQEKFITSRAGIVIKNVLPFLEFPNNCYALNVDPYLCSINFYYLSFFCQTSCHPTTTIIILYKLPSLFVSIIISSSSSNTTHVIPFSFSLCWMASSCCL